MLFEQNQKENDRSFDDIMCALTAEREGLADLEASRQKAEEIAGQARERAAAIEKRTCERIAKLQNAPINRPMNREAASGIGDELPATPPDRKILAAAVDHVAACLTGEA